MNSTDVRTAADGNAVRKDDRILTGNADLVGSGVWVPTDVQPGRTPLPGHEHAAPLASRTWGGA